MVMALEAYPLPLTVTPLGDEIPQAEPAVTNPFGNVRVIFPVVAGRYAEE